MGKFEMFQALFIPAAFYFTLPFVNFTVNILLSFMHSVFTCRERIFTFFEDEYHNFFK